MTFLEKLPKVQKLLRELDLDGWLIYDFRRTNDLACDFLEIPADTMLTRRFFYWIPKQGIPIKIVHAIEQHVLENLPGQVTTYRSWEELENLLSATLAGARHIAMEYSPRNAIPYVSKVDAGTMDVIRGFGIEVSCSCDLLQQYTCIWTEAQIDTHLEAAQVLETVVEKAWIWIADQLHSNSPVTDCSVQQFMLQEFETHDCITDHEPICAINADSANPHFSPNPSKARSIKKGDYILLDLWCKKKVPKAVYADITRVGVASERATHYQQEVFNVVKAARNAATGLVRDRLSQHKPVYGWEVDQAARDVITNAGYGDHILHRTGHSIGEKVHGNGANIDNLETQERRSLIPGTCFSIEPAIYLPGEFGVRLEYDILIRLDGSVHVTGGIQESIRTLF